MEPIYGLLGKKLGHSKSQPIHNAMGNKAYRLYELLPSELESFVKREDLGGVNVTIPYKCEVLKFCDEISDEARAVGSVNTIVRRQGRLLGYNTDVYGFTYMLKRAGISLRDKKVVILGSGGTSLTARAVCRQEQAASYYVISRSGQDNYDNLSRHYDADILINTTPVGMYPNCPMAAVDLRDFYKLSGVVDVIYNPLRTRLISQARELNIACTDGLPMLVAQADKADAIFFNREINEQRTEQILAELVREMLNIVLVGMPGCGKSSIGRALGELTGRQVIDLDSEIEKKLGCPIPRLIVEKGEAYFRDAEAQVALEFAKETGKIIVTGGGIVTREANFEALRQNGRVYWLKRKIELLPTRGRPLSGDMDRMRAMYEKRSPLYSRISDVEIENDASIFSAAEKISRDFYENTCY